MYNQNNFLGLWTSEFSIIAQHFEYYLLKVWAELLTNHNQHTIFLKEISKMQSRGSVWKICVAFIE